VITPPAGTAIAPETWEDETPTPVDPVASLHVIGRRVKITARNAQATLDELGKLRSELDEARAAGARREGKLEQVLATLEGERKERQQYTAVSVSAYQAAAEIEVKRALARIELERNQAAAVITANAEQTAYRRGLVLKIVAGIGAVWVVISAILLAKYT
jgi:hypothetical protein